MTAATHLYDAADVHAALTIAHHLTTHGVPVFVAHQALNDAGQWDQTGGTGGSGYHVPAGWQNTPATPDTLAAWRPGSALAAVMGHTVDAADVDPRHGGDNTHTEWDAAGMWPNHYGTQTTPSGGFHHLIAPLGVRSRDNALPGVDVKAGTSDGGHGFIWIAPTVKLSKTTGRLGAYRWSETPDLDALDDWAGADDTGNVLAERIQNLRTPTGKTVDAPHDAWDAMTTPQRDLITRYLAAIETAETTRFAEMATWGEGQRDEHGNGWERNTADLANRLGQLARADWTPWGQADAENVYRRVLPTVMHNAHPDKWGQQWHRREPATMPEQLANSLKWAGFELADILPSKDKTRCDTTPTATPAPSPPGLTSESATTPKAPDETVSAPTAVSESANPTLDLFNAAVDEQVRKLAIHAEARRRYAELTEPDAPPFDMGSLGEILARPEEPAARITGLIPWEASTLIVAQRKTGKTTLALNMAHALLTGEPLLDRFEVQPVTGSVALLNFEVTGRMVADWANHLGIPHDRFHLVNLRGRRNPFSNDEDRNNLSAQLRALNVETLICDPFGRAFTGTNQNDNGEVGAWLVMLDQFARAEVGAKDLILAAHAGWGETARARGASALEDLPDSLIYLTRNNDDDDEESARFFRASGRDVEVDEDEIRFDPLTHRLTLTGNGSAKQSKKSKALTAMAVIVCRAAFETPGISKAGIITYLKNSDDAPRGLAVTDGNVRDAIALATRQGRLRVESDGNGKPSRHYDAGLPVAGQAPTQAEVIHNPMVKIQPPQKYSEGKFGGPPQPPPNTPIRGFGGGGGPAGGRSVCDWSVIAGGSVHVNLATGETHDATQCPTGRP